MHACTLIKFSIVSSPTLTRSCSFTFLIPLMMMMSRLIDTETSDQWQYYYCDGTTSESTNARWPAYVYTYLRMVELPNANQFLRKNSRTIPSALSAFICMARATCNCLHPYLLVSGFSRYQRSLACTCQPALSQDSTINISIHWL